MNAQAAVVMAVALSALGGAEAACEARGGPPVPKPENDAVPPPKPRPWWEHGHGGYNLPKGTRPKRRGFFIAGVPIGHSKEAAR